MAFSTRNVQLSTRGNHWVLCGDWSGNSGDDSGTIAVGGANVVGVVISNSDPAPGLVGDRNTPFSITTNSTTGLSTVLIHNHANVTNGNFAIEYV